MDMSRRTMTPTAFNARLHLAKAGQVVVYHVGFLAADRMDGLNTTEVHRTATAAWDAYEAGKAYLVKVRACSTLWPPQLDGSPCGGWGNDTWTDYTAAPYRCYATVATSHGLVGSEVTCSTSGGGP